MSDFHLDRENSLAAFKAISAKFHGGKLATGHIISVEQVLEVPCLRIKSVEQMPIVALSINDQQFARPVTLFAVRCRFRRFELYRLSDGSPTSDTPVDDLDSVCDGIETLLENIDQQDIDEAIDACKPT